MEPWKPRTRCLPSSATPALNQSSCTKFAAKTRRDSGLEVTAAQVLVTNGGKQAVANTFAALCDPGDEVLVPAPYWTTYPEVIILAGGVPVVVPTGAAAGFRVTVDQLEAAAERKGDARAAQSDVDEEFAILRDDRSRLAVELDGALTRPGGFAHIKA